MITPVSINSSVFSQTPPLRQNNAEQAENKTQDTAQEEEKSFVAEKDKTDESKKSELSDTDKRKVEALKLRDTEVKNHEMAHIAAGAQYITKRATFEYETGPDKNRYAVGGEVGIDVSKEDDPQATINKMQTVKKAALAPAEPSSTDRAVASSAARIEMEARLELSQESLEQMNGKKGKSAYGEEKEEEKGGLLDLKI